MFTITGCIPTSIHPLYNDQTITYDENLVGKWTNGESTWQFTPAGDNSYDLKVIEDNKKAQLVVHMVEFGGMRFLDLFPGENEALENTAATYQILLVPTHTFMKVDRMDSHLQLRYVIFNDIIEEDPNILEFSKSDDTIIITASTEQLQKVIIEHGDEVIDTHGTDDESEMLIRMEPLFTEDEIVFDENLLGQWTTENDETLDMIETVPGQGYDLLFTGSDGQQHNYQAKLIQTQNITLLGLYAFELTDKDAEYNLHLLPDFFVIIDELQPKLKIRKVDYSEMKDILTGQPQTEQDKEPDMILTKQTSY